MYKDNQLILIGSTGRNSGKTTLAEALIRAACETEKPIGLKVTTIQDRHALCPRGGEGCGACGSLEGDFYLEREDGSNPRKDTARLLAAGCAEVYWLRVRKDCLLEGYLRFKAQLKGDPLIICESNSLRHAVIPRSFIMIQNTTINRAKQTALDVMEYADVVYEGEFRLNSELPIDLMKGEDHE